MDLEGKVDSYLSAEVAQAFEKNYEINTSTPFEDFGLEIEAKSALVVREKDNKKKILFKKYPQKKLPIASLTKLMTGVVAIENYDLDQTTIISERAVSKNGDSGKLIQGEEKTVKELLEVMLVRSSNDAAWALTEIMGTEKFISKMNSKAEELGLNDTHFVNPSGLENGHGSNISTTKDLLKLVNYLFENEKRILMIGASPSSLNTNKLIFDYSNIIGSKTGYTNKAGGCLIMVLEDDRGYHYVNILLGSENRNSRFREMRKIINLCNNLKLEN